VLHAGGKWLFSLRHFLADSECTHEIANTYILSTRWANDCILMEGALTRDYTVSEIQAINRCRLYLQVECLSNICTADGLRKDPGLRAQPPTVTSQSTIQWRCRSGQHGIGSLTRIHAPPPRANDYVKPWAPGRDPTFGSGQHTTIHQHKCSV
jgi:hypothetical protein